MAQLGSFGVVHEETTREPDTFEYFGSTIRVVGEVNQIELIDLMDSTRGIDADGPAALSALKDVFRLLIDQRDFAGDPVTVGDGDQAATYGGFWALARRNRQTAEDLAQLMEVLFEGAVGRPTQQQPASSAGLPTTRPSLPGVSSSAEPSGPVVHRPDLQLIRDDYEATKARLLAG